MPDPSAGGLNLWWVITIGTGTALVLALGFVLVVLYHERSNRELERKSEQRYADLFHTVNDLIYVHSADGVIEEVNNSVTALLALPRDGIVGRSIREFLPSGYRRFFDRYLEAMRQAGSGTEVTGLLPISRASAGGHAAGNRPGGEVSRELVILEYRSRAVRDGDGKVISVRGIARDQTRRIQQERSLVQSHRKIQDLFRESERMRTEISTLSQKMMQVQEEDRLRISRELHDEVGQSLTAIATNLEVLRQDSPVDQPDLQGRLAETQQLTREVTQSIRRVSRELRPIAIDELGLLPALEKYVRDFESRSGIRTVFSYDPLEEELSLNEKVTIYRVIQESLTNIARHSKASEVRISLLERETPGAGGPDALTSLEIHDNGRGMPEDDDARAGASPDRPGLPGGVGLLGMQERVKLHAGTFQLTSGLNKGTRIFITLPRRNHEKDAASTPVA